ncbi:MAG: hypothetical protein JWM93_1396 [Frankiales bacterium]|nr:hypothetical protein [Frankiales bacterium]
MPVRVGNRSWYLEMIDVATEAQDQVQAALDQGDIGPASTERLRRLSRTLRGTIAEYTDLVYPSRSAAAALAPPETSIDVLEVPARVMNPLRRSRFSSVERIEVCLRDGGMRALAISGIGAKGRAQIEMAVAIYRAGGTGVIVDTMVGA